MSRRTRPYWTLDSETDPFREGRVPEPFLWGVYDGVNYDYWQFEEIDDLVEFLRDKDVIVYAHNGGKFDYHPLRAYIDSDSPITVISGRMSKFTIGACEFRDSLNLFGQTKLSDFSKMQIDYKILEKSERHKPENWKLICEYLKSDCVNLFELVHAFIERYGMHLTQASAAMKYWSKNYKVPIPESTKEFYDDFHDFYYGGRVQCFSHGHHFKRGKAVDRNSAYPKVMCEQHPISTDAIVSKKLPETPKRLGPCMVEIDAISHGALPKYAEDHQGLYFPDDSDSRAIRRYTVTGWEVLAGLETQTLEIVQVHAVHKFTETISFEEYIHHFYNKRKLAKAVGDKAEDIFCKNKMNSLYGKFAANPRKYQEYVLPSDEKLAEWIAQGWVTDGNWNDRLLMTRPLPEDRHRYYNIATAASVTGCQRAEMWRVICMVDDPIYCDTDGLLCGDVGAMELGSELGQWKLEYEFDEYAIAGKKTYAVHKTPEFFSKKDHDPETPWAKEWKVASKGVRLTPEEVIAVSEGVEFTHLAKVPNYSVHRRDIIFLNRHVRKTYRDVSIFPQVQEAA